MRKYDTLAISLLIFSAVLTAAISIDPKGFALRDWQPLIAALLALGGASIVYRGATLAYRAAMAKVDFDREVLFKTERRKVLGLCFRLKHSLQVLRHEAVHIAELISEPNDSHEIEFKSERAKLTPPEALFEAWGALENFPQKLVLSLSEVRGGVYDIDVFLKFSAGNTFKIQFESDTPAEIQFLRNATSAVVKSCEVAIGDINSLIRNLTE
jgi:hypothetical protein